MSEDRESVPDEEREALLTIASGAVVASGIVPVTARLTGIWGSLRGARAEARRFHNHAVPVAMSQLGKVFQNRLDVLLVGLLLRASAAGVSRAGCARVDSARLVQPTAPSGGVGALQS